MFSLKIGKDKNFTIEMKHVKYEKIEEHVKYVNEIKKKQVIYIYCTK